LAEGKEHQLMSRFSRVLIAGASALGIGALVALPSTLSATAATALPHFRTGHVINYTPRSHVTWAQIKTATAASKSFPQFTGTAKVGSTTYHYVIAGKNPAKKVKNASTTINAELVPLVMKFANSSDVWNPTKKDSCDSGASALTRMQNGPLVTKHNFSFGGTKIGDDQLTDAYQRADFWKYAKPKGINPSYGVSLKWKTLKPVTVTVPDADAATAMINCGNGLLGAANINWLLPHLDNTVIPSLAKDGVGPTNVPVFLMHNFVIYDGTVSDCCILGYHYDYSAKGAIQTYGIGDYDNSGAFAGFNNITGLTHEIAEWENDPYGNNPTPAWGHTGQDPNSCQNNLEVGDPLTGHTFAVKVGSFTYHPQELAFLSWFYHQKPSIGVNGWYSDQDTFKTYAKPCS
jgi:hypothetical protein